MRQPRNKNGKKCFENMKSLLVNLEFTQIFTVNYDVCLYKEKLISVIEGFLIIFIIEIWDMFSSCIKIYNFKLVN